jgi:hypothetical protein
LPTLNKHFQKCLDPDSDPDFVAQNEAFFQKGIKSFLIFVLFFTTSNSYGSVLIVRKTMQICTIFERFYPLLFKELVCRSITMILIRILNMDSDLDSCGSGFDESPKVGSAIFLGVLFALVHYLFLRALALVR